MFEQFIRPYPTESSRCGLFHAYLLGHLTTNVHAVVALLMPTRFRCHPVVHHPVIAYSPDARRLIAKSLCQRAHTTPLANPAYPRERPLVTR